MYSTVYNCIDIHTSRHLGTSVHGRVKSYELSKLIPHPYNVNLILLKSGAEV